MATLLRIEFSGALYYVTSRSDRQAAIYEDDEDQKLFPGTLAEVVQRFKRLCHAYCLVTNHHHLVVETVGAHCDLSICGVRLVRYAG